MRQNIKNFMVSYMVNGERKKFIVPACRKTDAIIKAEQAGALPFIPKAVQELNRDIKTY